MYIKTIQAKDIVVVHEQIHNIPTLPDVDIVYKQVTKDDKQNKEAYVTFFSKYKELIDKQIPTYKIVSERVRKSRIDELNSIPKYHKITGGLIRATG